MIKIFFSFFILFYINSQEIIKITSIENSILIKSQTENYKKFYSFQIPEKFSLNSMLIFTLNQNKNDFFNDANIFISKSNKFPTSKLNSNFHSEIYGNKLISIPSNEIKSNEIFYIGILCEKICDFSLKIEFSQELKLNISQIYTISINKEKTLNYYYEISNEKNNEFNIIANNKNFKSFKIFVSEKNSFSNENLLKSIPIFFWLFFFNKKH